MWNAFLASAATSLAAIMMVSTTPSVLDAQGGTTPRVYYACYVPGSGTVYRIREPGLQQSCTAKNNAPHVEFSWTDGADAVRSGDAAGGDLGGTFPNPSVLKLLGRAIATTAPTNGQVYAWDATASQWVPTTVASGASDHGALTGLEDDDHPQYLKVGAAAAGDLTGTFASPSVAKLRGISLAAAPPTTGQVLTFDGTAWTPGTVPSSIRDHGELEGLDDDDHLLYLRADGARIVTGTLDLNGNRIANLAEAILPGQAVPWQQAVKRDDRAGGDLEGSFSSLAVTGLRSRPLSAVTPTAGQVLTFDGSAWAPATPPSGTSDHGTLAGLTDDDHPQYLRTDGARALAAPLAAGGFRITNLGAAVMNGDALRFEQAIKVGEVAQGDLSGNYPTVIVDGLQGRAVSSAAPTPGQVLTFNGTSWVPTSPATGGGTADHGALTGLGDDDHPQYMLANGTRTTTNGFAVVGTGTATAPPVSGAGTRMMWYPMRAAFRAGVVTANQWDETNVGYQSAAFGYNARAVGDWSFAAGSDANASGSGSVAMGATATAGELGAVALGNFVTASASRSLALGSFSTANANGAISIGRNTIASGQWSTAMGQYSSTEGYLGSFVWSGGGSESDRATPSATGQFVVRAGGGIRLRNSGNTAGPLGSSSFGCDIDNGNLTCSGTLTTASDATLKTRFEPIDGDDVLLKLAGLRIERWSYRADGPDVRHVGPTAQDFHAAFGLGTDDRTISMVDGDGVNMLAIQALERRTRALQQDIDATRRENAELRDRLAKLEQAMERLSSGKP